MEARRVMIRAEDVGLLRTDVVRPDDGEAIIQPLRDEAAPREKIETRKFLKRGAVRKDVPPSRKSRRRVSDTVVVCALYILGFPHTKQARRTIMRRNAAIPSEK